MVQMSISGTLEVAGVTFFPAILSVIGCSSGLLAPGLFFFILFIFFYYLLYLFL
jgi:hypothetical protein